MAHDNCEHCGATFELQRGNSRRFCYDCLKPYAGASSIVVRCYNVRYQQLLAGKVGPRVVPLRAPTRKHNCATCGELFRFAVGTKSAARSYCHTCEKQTKLMYKYGLRLAGEQRDCRWCLKPFEQNKRHQLTCSKDCGWRLKHHFITYGAPDRCNVRLCIDCCTPFWGAPGQRTLCFGCQGARRGVSEARRRLAEAKGDKDIHWSTVGERDGFACHLCGKRVARKAGTHDQRQGAVVDHLVPLADGGRHTWDNVAVAHWDCNQRRGHTGAAQLRLVG